MALSTHQNGDGLNLSPTAIQFLSIRDAVMARWEAEARSRVPGANTLLSPTLTNTLPAFLDNIAEALSPNCTRSLATSDTNVAAAHGGERARTTQFGPDQVVQEYQILRESIMVEAHDKVNLSTSDCTIIDRSINSAVREAIREFFSEQVKLRRTVAAALSHDMRTPLSVISHAAELIKLSSDAEVTHRAASKISSNVERLSEMMSELLEALTVNIGEKLPLNLTSFNIADLIRKICVEYSQDNYNTIRFDTEAIHGYWCYSAIRRAIENLVNNAMKYGDGGLVNVEAKHSHGRLLLSVHNTGNPIAKKDIESLFENVVREGASHASGGWGIGLPFVKRVAEGHGGSVAVDSSAEGGTTVLIDIPVDCRPFVEN